MNTQQRIVWFLESLYTVSETHKGGIMADKPIPDHMRILAERVHLLRRRQRFSQAAIAKSAGMSPTTMSNIEQAKMPTITVEHLVALARVLGTVPDYLLGLSDNPRPPKRPRPRTAQPVG
jgi:DNA-binding XRE family transcriptional regulator